MIPSVRRSPPGLRRRDHNPHKQAVTPQVTACFVFMHSHRSTMSLTEEVPKGRIHGRGRRRMSYTSPYHRLRRRRTNIRDGAYRMLRHGYEGARRGYVTRVTQTYGLSDPGLTSVPPTEAAALQRVAPMRDMTCNNATSLGNVLIAVGTCHGMSAYEAPLFSIS